MQPIRPNHVSFNIVTCDWECIPETCNDDTYYWDSKLCKCLCYPQVCAENYEWNVDSCECDCLGIPAILNEAGVLVNECPCGYIWEPDCCMCQPCQDQGLCDPMHEFFNPVTCECTCIPVCCPEGLKFDSLACKCAVDVC